jgi:hypothetical protein
MRRRDFLRSAVAGLLTCAMPAGLLTTGISVKLRDPKPGRWENHRFRYVPAESAAAALLRLYRERWDMQTVGMVSHDGGKTWGPR